jgi:hypothetical protein
VRIYEDKEIPFNEKMVVVLSQLPMEESVVSITNEIEVVSTEILYLILGWRYCMQRSKTSNPIQWIIHYSPSVSVRGEEEFIPVVLKYDEIEDELGNPLWGTPLSRKDLEVLIGCPFEI